MMPKANGFCFLVSLQGGFRGYAEKVLITTSANANDDNTEYWILTGSSGSAGVNIIGKAICFQYQGYSDANTMKSPQKKSG
jgi:hypothetical protein